MIDPVPGQARTELTRLVDRWHQLPIDRARSASPYLRASAEALFTLAKQAGQLPDLGPAVALDQLQVAVYEASRAGADGDELAKKLSALRREYT